jgi:regulator of protease activity HflC (stomatin/prohibitin superfamily)
MGILVIMAMAVLALAAALTLLWAVQRVVIGEYERGLLYRRGRFVAVLDAGAYWLLRPVSAVTRVDLRSRIATVPAQEILSADNVALRLTLALRYRVARPEVAVAEATSFAEALYLEAQLAARTLVAAQPAEELLARRGALADDLRVVLQPRASALGLELETVGVKDVTFPGALKQVFAQVVEARHAGLAALEKARGETAALRQMANAARLLREHPELTTMRTLQAVDNGRNTIVLGMPQTLLSPGPERGEEPGRERA